MSLSTRPAHRRPSPAPANRPVGRLRCRRQQRPPRRRRGPGGRLTTFLTVRAFGRLAKGLPTLRKDAAVLIVGERSPTWTARDSSENRRKYKVLATTGGPDCATTKPAGGPAAT